MYVTTDDTSGTRRWPAMQGALVLLAACASPPPARTPAANAAASPTPTAEPSTGSLTKLVIGYPTTTNGVGPGVVRRALQRKGQQLTYCYDKWLVISNSSADGQLVGDITDSRNAGAVELSFTIGADGNVATASAKGIAEIVESCLTEAVQHLQLEKAPTGGVDVVVTLRYSPPGT